MNFAILYNKVHVYNVDLGNIFSNIQVDLVLDRNGNVKIISRITKFTFYSNLTSLNAIILKEISNFLSDQNIKSALIIKQKIDSELRNKIRDN
jgi:hypothetical protein